MFDSKTVEHLTVGCSDTWCRTLDHRHSTIWMRLDITLVFPLPLQLMPSVKLFSITWWDDDVWAAGKKGMRSAVYDSAVITWTEYMTLEVAWQSLVPHFHYFKSITTRPSRASISDTTQLQINQDVLARHCLTATWGSAPESHTCQIMLENFSFL